MQEIICARAGASYERQRITSGRQLRPSPQNKHEPPFGAFVLWRWEHRACARCGGFEPAEPCFAIPNAKQASCVQRSYEQSELEKAGSISPSPQNK